MTARDLILIELRANDAVSPGRAARWLVEQLAGCDDIDTAAGLAATALQELRILGFAMPDGDGNFICTTAGHMAHPPAGRTLPEIKSDAAALLVVVDENGGLYDISAGDREWCRTAGTNTCNARPRLAFAIVDREWRVVDASGGMELFAKMSGIDPTRSENVS